ncbi:unnamed protein product [Protopolystoma xenopodis]|uniref:Uncharacterized protein n=1 Tax=Protopolystoma xenopodis TaxID=117903 RepID=A0A3S5APD6_9PLAT|nr:unnamed protein product [Protopolystoma xenopodis]
MPLLSAFTPLSSSASSNSEEDARPGRYLLITSSSHSWSYQQWALCVRVVGTLRGLEILILAKALEADRRDASPKMSEQTSHSLNMLLALLDIYFSIPSMILQQSS